MKLDVSEQKVALLRDGTLLPSGTTGTISNNIFTATVSAGYYVVNITNTSSSGEQQLHMISNDSQRTI